VRAIGIAWLIVPVHGGEVADGAEGSKVAETPDLVQTCRAAGFFKGGSDYCGPVAASNSLVWLARRGALAGEFEKPGDQYALAVGENGLAKMKQAPVSGRLWKSSQSGVGKRD
jgi:hypothetical protein